jgi:hypothetical protein
MYRILYSYTPISFFSFIKIKVYYHSFEYLEIGILFQMYYVLTWDKYCSVVPDLWVNFSEKTFAYPSTGITQTIKKRICSQPDWEIYEYRKILGPYKNYEMARSAEKTCVTISSSDEIQFTALSEQSTQILPSKRPR